MAFGYDVFDDLDFVDPELDELFDRGGSRIMFRLEEGIGFEEYIDRLLCN